MGFGGGLESWEDTSALHSCGRQVHFQGKGLLANLISRPQFCSEPDRRPEEPVAVSCDFPGAAPAPPSCAAGVSPLTAASDQSVERGILSRLPGKESNCVICAFPVTVANHVGHLEQLALCAFCAEQGVRATSPSGWGSAESSTSELGWARALGLCGHGYFRPPLSLNVICVCCLAPFSGPNPFLHSSLQPLCQSCGPFLISRAGKVRVVLLDPYVSGQPVHRVFTAASRLDLPRPFPASRSFLWQAPVGPEKDTISFPNPCDPSVPEGPNPNFQDGCFESGLGAPAPAACGESDRCPDEPEALSCDVLGAASAPPLFTTEASPRTASLAFVGCGMVCGFHGNETHCVICALPLAVAIHVGHFDQPELCAFCADQEAGAVPPASRHSAVLHGAGRVPSVLLDPYVSGPLVHRVFNAASCQDPPRPFPAISPLSQAGQPCDASVPRCMPSVPASPPLVALGFRPDSAVQPPLVSGTMALGPSSPRSVAIGFRPDSAVQPPLLRGTVSDSATSGSWPQEAVPRHNVSSPCLVPSLRAHRAGAAADCGVAFPSFQGQAPLSFAFPVPSASFPSADPNGFQQRSDWRELHPNVCGAPKVCAVCQQEPVLGLAVDQEVQDFMQACSKAHHAAPREELYVAMHDAMSYCPHCLCVWEASLRKYRYRAAALAELSGPLYFTDHEVAQELDDRVESAGLLCSEPVPLIRSYAGSDKGCRPGVPSSRRSRRRYNRRLRREAANQFHRASLGPLFEPLLLEQGAPKTPDEEVTTSPLCQATNHGFSFLDPLEADVRLAGNRSIDQYEVSPASSVQALWSCVASGLRSHSESEVVHSVSCLEDSGQIHEGTFEWTAAELAVDSIQDVARGPLLNAAVSAVHDVIANFKLKPTRGALSILSFNATSWRSALAKWSVELRPDLVLVQETHLSEELGPTIAQQVGAFGYNVSTLAAVATGGGGNSGGLAILSRKHLDVRQVAHFSCKGAGFLASAVRVRGCDLFVATVYLRSGEGFQSQVNSAVLGRLVPFLKSVRGAYFVAGDFNEDLDVLAETSLAAEAGGGWIGPGGPTLTSGGQLDFALVSNALLPVVMVQLDWATPFKPHAALRWSLDIAALSTQVPQLCGFKPQEPAPQPFVLRAADRPVSILGHTDLSPLTEAFANLSFSAELSVYGSVQGRGVEVKSKHGPLPVQGIPQFAWGGRAAALWGRLATWASSSRLQGRSVGPYAKVFLGKLDQVWQGDQVSLESFRIDLQRSLDSACPNDFACVASGADKQHAQHSKQWLDEQAATYSKWLSAASQKGMRPLFRAVRKQEESFDRPFRDKSLLDRVYHRWLQWHAIWCQDVTSDPNLFATLKNKAVAQAQELQPIPLQEAVTYFRKFPCKAPGADGWTSQMLRNLSDEAIQAILDFYRACELRADWPAQFAVNLIVLLPKSWKRERPIALMHVLYRAYVRLRWHLVARWQLHYARLGTWDKATPGSGVLDIALSRLVRGETARCHKEHLCTLFVDLETFYDRCRFDDVISSGLALGYPPLILHQALLLYKAPRLLSAENTLAPAIFPHTGVLAGCPAAPSISKLVVHTAAATLVRRPGATNLDVWIDDLSLDSVHSSPQQLASVCLRLFRGLASSLEDMGAKVSLDKTCFVASSAAAAKALNSVRRPEDPRVRLLARDLGVTSNGARRRVLGLAAARRAKAGVRAKRLNRLGVPHVSHRIRIVKASIISSGLWGHQAIGVSPKRRKWYRTLCGRHLGRQRLGSLDCVFAIFEKRCEDPHFTILRQHVRAVFRVFQSWHAQDRAKFEATWLSLWHHLSQSPSAWKRVTGPISATIAYLLELKVTCETPGLWKHPQGDLHIRWDTQDVVRSVWSWMERLLRSERLQRIAGQEGCSLLRQGADLTVPRKLAKRKHLHRNTLVGLSAVWQGALVSASKPGWCRRCRCSLSLQHVLWDCPFIANKFPDEFQKERLACPWPSLWLRGLPPLSVVLHPSPAQALLGVQVEGIFATGQLVDGSGLVFASDGSGGPGGSDSRLLLSCWAIGAYVLEASAARRVGSVTCLLPFALTVPQTEQQALFELLSRVQGDFDVTVDCKSVKQLLQKQAPPLEGPVPWGLVWDRRHHAKTTWVNSHRDAAHFDRQGWPQWRREINADVDSLCQDRCKRVFVGSHKVWLKGFDKLVGDVSHHLARKANFILQHRKDPAFPWILGRPLNQDSPTVPSGPQENTRVRPNPAFQKSAAPNKKQRMLACIEASVDTLGHKWVKGADSGNNLTMKCESCGLYVQQVCSLSAFNRLMRHHCVNGQGTLPSEWGVHQSHCMVNMGVQWTCTRCGRLQRPHLETASGALKKPCDGRGKAGKVAQQAQGLGSCKLVEAATTVHVHKTKVPFGTKRTEPDAQDSKPSQSVLRFGQPAVLVGPKPKASSTAPAKQTKLVFKTGAATKPQ